MKPKNWAKILGVVALLAVTVAVAAEVTKPVCGTWRYKLTVNVDTPEGMKSGSAVREAEICLADHLAPEAPDVDIKPRGEAVVIDLGKRGALFVLTAFGDYQLLISAFPRPLALTEEGLRYYENLKAKTTLKPEQYPQIVMFKDINDPKSVVLVKGWHFDVQKQEQVPVDNFNTFFGNEVKLKEIVIETTDEPVTWFVEKYLFWLTRLKGGYLHGGFTSGDAPLGLHGGNFKNGEIK